MFETTREVVLGVIGPLDRRSVAPKLLPTYSQYSSLTVPNVHENVTWAPARIAPLPGLYSWAVGVVTACATISCAWSSFAGASAPQADSETAPSADSAIARRCALLRMFTIPSSSVGRGENATPPRTRPRSDTASALGELLDVRSS